MIARILSLFVLIVFFSGGAWYVLRDTPEKQIVRWRSEAEKILFDKTADLERAEELNGKILKWLPYSAYDLIFKARINERKGTSEGLKQALNAYDKVLATGDPATLGVAFLKARACRALGLLSEAKGTLFSVVDVFPFESMMELGETALSALSAKEALRCFSKALEVASTKTEEARAHEGMANTYRLLLALNSGRQHADARDAKLQESGPQTGSPENALENAPEKTIEELKESARNSLQKALELVKTEGMPASPQEANQRFLWASSLTEKLVQFKRPGETPCWQAVVWIRLKMADYSGVMNEVSPELRIRLAALRLSAAKDEAALLPQGLAEELSREAEREFLDVLGNKAVEAKALLSAAEEGKGRESESSEAKASKSYFHGLLSISKVFLASPNFQMLLADPSPLELSRRIADVMDSPNSDAAAVFSLIAGFAHLKAGEITEADKLLEKYLLSLSSEAKPPAALDIAEQVLRLRPSDPLVFRYMDRFFDYEGKPLDLVGKRISLLITARSQEPLAKEASARLDAAIKKAEEKAESAAERVAFAKILYGVRGRRVAIDSIRETRERYPYDSALKRVFADLLLEEGNASLSMDQKDSAALAYREALGEYLHLFIKSPTESQDVLVDILEVLRKLGGRNGGDREEDLALKLQLKTLFPAVSGESLDLLVHALRGFFHRQFGPALDRASAIKEPQEFEPFLSFLKGSCHIGLMVYLERDAAKASSDAARDALNAQRKEHVREAREEFQKWPDFVASKLELASLEFQLVPQDKDVPEDLLQRIQDLAKTERVEHRADFLLSRALARRFECRYQDKTVKNSELARVLAKEQKALRSTIRRKTTFAPAYLALADTFLISSRTDASTAENGSTARQMFSPDFQKAVNVLKALPVPDEQVTVRLVDCLEGSGRLEEAARFLEQLALSRPDPAYFSRLFSIYLQIKEPGLSLILDEKAPEAEKPPEGKFPKERFQLLTSLKKGFSELPEHEPLRYSLLGTAAAKKEAEASSDAEKSQLRGELIDHYTRALSSYEAKGLPVPMVVLNNLAWYLAEDPREERRSRAIEVAARAKGRVTPVQMPEVYDTYGWALYRNHRLGEAEQAFRALLEVVDTPTFRYHLAMVLLDSKKYDEALSQVRRALDSPRFFPEQTAVQHLEAEIREARRKALGGQER